MAVKRQKRLADKNAGDVLLELRNVHKSFGSKKILQGATLQVRRGQAIGIIGEKRCTWQRR
jgi:ABC-type histidine transport system ATPase subunit